MTKDQVIERHIISVLVDNEPGVLARVIGLFSGRGYNIESLTVSETDEANSVSRISIVTSGTPMVIEQIKAQLARLVPIHSVCDLTEMGVAIERELALVKIINTGDARIECLRIADTFRARTLDSTLDILWPPFDRVCCRLYAPLVQLSTSMTRLCTFGNATIEMMTAIASSHVR